MTELPLGANDPIRKLSRDGLLAEIARLRSRTRSKEGAEALRSAERERTRAEALRAELDDLKTQTGEAGIEGEEVGGHPAVASFRKAWRGFTSTILRLPAEREAGGFSRVRLLASKAILADLAIFELIEPRGPLEARARDVLRRCFTHPGRLDKLSRRTPGSERFRSVVIAEAVRLHFRPSVWRVYEKTAEDRDRWSNRPRTR